jgi:prepilin-type processing-associated H-X9-DG protein
MMTRSRRRGVTLFQLLIVLAILAILIGLLLPAVQKAREAAFRTQSSNNLRQIGLALHAYHDSTKHFPPAAIYDKSGKPLLSWRVLILPYVEAGDLYSKFKLDEPWDSEHNKKLLDPMPLIYAGPGGKKSTETAYLAFHGKNAFFEEKEGLKISTFTDGLSKTIAVVEAAQGVPWTKPEDLAYDPEKPPPKVGGVCAGGFNALFADGHVTFFPDGKVKPEVMHLLIQRNDGKRIPLDDF